MLKRSWSDQARRLLTDWQRDELKRLGMHQPTKEDIAKVAAKTAALLGHGPDSADHKAVVAYMIAQHQEIQAQLPTPFESSAWYPLAMMLAQDVESTARARALALPVEPLIGSVPSGMVNASTYYLPQTGEYLIVFAAGLFLFLNLMAKVAADVAVAAAQATTPGRALDHAQLPRILADKRFHDRFFDALYNHVVLGRASAAQQYLLPEPANSLATSLRHTMELFIVAHEYGHIIQGHLTKVPQQPKPETTRSGEFVYQPEWLEELAADDCATEIVLHDVVAKGGNPHNAVASIHLVLFCLELVDRAVNALMAPANRTAQIMDSLISTLGHSAVPAIFSEGERPGDSHPAAASRRFKQRARFGEFLDSRLADEGNEMGTDLVVMLDYLWHAARPRWIEMRESGVKPCALWDPRAQP
jgi:hypothetical protein